MTVLITGAGRGIGLALASEALARGHEVIGTTRGPRLASFSRLPSIFANTGTLAEYMEMDMKDSFG